MTSQPAATQTKRPGLAARAVFVLLCGIGLAIPIARADAQTVDGLNSKIADAKDEAQALNGDIEDSVVALAAARQEASQAAGREAELSQVLADGKERSAKLADRLAEAQAQLDDARSRLTRAQDALADRLVAIYKSGGIDEAQILLSADGYEDLATRADLLDRIQDADRALAERVRDLRAQIASQVSKVERAKERSDTLNAQVETARNEIAAARAEAQARADAAAAAKADQASSLEALQGKMDGWSEDVQKLEQVSEEEADEEVASWPSSGPWAIPEAIVMCESGGNYSALNPTSGAGGAYQILPSTWRAYGGKGLPHLAPPAEQDRIAAMIWADSGPAAWECAG